MRTSRLLRWLNRTPVQTFILCPLLVVGFELVRRARSAPSSEPNPGPAGHFSISGRKRASPRTSSLEILRHVREMMLCRLVRRRRYRAQLSRMSCRALSAAARFSQHAPSPRWEQELPMNNASVSIPPPSLAAAKSVTPSTAARTKLLLEGPILPTLLRLAAPNVLNLLAFAGVITFDGFFLGRIETNALAGASLAFPWVMLVLQTTNSGMGAGVSSAVARALGAGRRDRADALVFHAFLLALAIAAIFSTVLLIGAPFMFRWMG